MQIGAVTLGAAFKRYKKAGFRKWAPPFCSYTHRNTHSTHSVVASYKPSMLVTGARFPVCAFFARRFGSRRSACRAVQQSKQENAKENGELYLLLKTVWPSGLRRWLKAPVRKGVGSNPTAVISKRQQSTISKKLPFRSQCSVPSIVVLESANI